MVGVGSGPGAGCGDWDDRTGLEALELATGWSKLISIAYRLIVFVDRAEAEVS